jgi:valyl-tRNA synthetase
LQKLVTEVRGSGPSRGCAPRRVPRALAGWPARRWPSTRAGARPGRPRAAGRGLHAVGDPRRVGGRRRGDGRARPVGHRRRRRRAAPLGKDREAALKLQAQAQGKLGNEGFLAKAPDAVVAKVRAQLDGAQADLRRLDAALAASRG